MTQPDKPVSGTVHVNIELNTELYIRLIDLLQEFQLPGGKFDGHRLISALADAKQYRSTRALLKACEEVLRGIEASPSNRQWINDAARALLAKIRGEGI